MPISPIFNWCSSLSKVAGGFVPDITPIQPSVTYTLNLGEANERNGEGEGEGEGRRCERRGLKGGDRNTNSAAWCTMLRISRNSSWKERRVKERAEISRVDLVISLDVDMFACHWAGSDENRLQLTPRTTKKGNTASKRTVLDWWSTPSVL